MYKIKNMIQFSHPLMDTDEYKELFKQYKHDNPYEYDYFLHLACLTQLSDQKKQDIIKSDINIETEDEIQEEHPTK
jgi:hypothetical protein